MKIIVTDNNGKKYILSEYMKERKLRFMLSNEHQEGMSVSEDDMFKLLDDYFIKKF